MVKEGVSDYDLPGGGLDHGECIEAGLRREIFEELDTEVQHIATQPSFVWPLYSTRHDCHLLWICYEAELTSLDFTLPDDTRAADWFSAEQLSCPPLDAKMQHYIPELQEYLKKM